MQQQKNLLLFFVLSFLIFVSWSALQNTLWPPKPKALPVEIEEGKKEDSTPHLLEGLTPQGVAALVGAGAQFTLGRWAGLEAKEWAVHDAEPPKPVVVAKQERPREIVLGDDDTYNLKIILTSRGAGVEEVILNKFREASELGLPVFEDERKRVPETLHLVPKDGKDGTIKKIDFDKMTLTLTVDDKDREFSLTKEMRVVGSDASDLKDRLKGFKEGAKVFFRAVLKGETEAIQELRLDDGTGPNPSYLLFHYPDVKATNPVDTLGHASWTVVEEPVAAGQGEQKVVFQQEIPRLGLKITKTYTLQKDDYHLGLEVKVEALRDQAVDFRYQLAGAHGLPIEGVWYTYVYRNSLIGVIDSHGGVTRDLQDSRSIGLQDGGLRMFKGDGTIGYAGVVNQYFASMIVVDDQQDDKGFLEWARPTREGTPNVQKPFLDDITTRVNSLPLVVKPGKPVIHRYLLYNGPVKVRLLGTLEGAQAVSADPAKTRELVDRYENTLHLNTLTDYPGTVAIKLSWTGWPQLLIWSTNLMHGLLDVLHGILRNYGVCIVLLTVLVRGAMFPLSRRQAIAGARMQEKMAVLAPEVKKLEEKHKNDPMALQQARTELYMRHGINPLAMAGSCWMVLLQMPIFLGLYYCLQESIHFRLAEFLWIKNLAAPDMLFWWGPDIPWISRPHDQGGFIYLGPFFNILPLIAVGFMIVQQKMMTPPPTDEQQAMQQKMMKYMMILFGFMFYKVAAGLCIYFIASSIWGVTERKLLPKRQPAGALATAEGPPAGGSRGRNNGAARTGSSLGRGRTASRDDNNGDGLVQRLKDWWAEVLKQARKK